VACLIEAVSKRGRVSLDPHQLDDGPLDRSGEGQERLDGALLGENRAPDRSPFLTKNGTVE
jgi:hypothetical protein